MSARIEPTCGKWMPRAKEHCARGAGHAPPCATAAHMENQRQRAADRRPDRVVTAEDRARWNKAWKFSRFGITEARFNQMMEDQGHACAMCGEPLGDACPNIDHDHACCPVPAGGRARSCGKCIRGLLCFRCDTALGYIELYGDLARAYLDNPPARTT